MTYAAVLLHSVNGTRWQKVTCENKNDLRSSSITFRKRNSLAKSHM
jgi:hypothetical protein